MVQVIYMVAMRAIAIEDKRSLSNPNNDQNTDESYRELFKATSNNGLS